MNKFILLDGDQFRGKFDPSTFTQTEAGDFNFLKEKVESETGIGFENLPFRIDGVNGTGNVSQKITGSLKYLSYLYKNLGYLPGDIPEETIWDDAFVAKSITAMGKPLPTFPDEYKKKIMAFANALFEDESSASIEAIKKLLLGELISQKGATYQSIADTLIAFKGSLTV